MLTEVIFYLEFLHFCIKDANIKISILCWNGINDYIDNYLLFMNWFDIR